MRYLIIGGAGFIGSNFTYSLINRGDEVTIFDNLSRKGSEITNEWLKTIGAKFIRGDIRKDIDLLDREIIKNDVVYHLAGQVAVTTSVSNPRNDFENNTLGTFNVLESIRKSDNQPILIYASTNKVYGELKELEIATREDRYFFVKYKNGINEEMLLDFHSPYGCSKGSADQYVRDFNRIYGLRTVVMRQSCIYGPRQIGVEDQGWLAWFAISALHKRTINIFGDGKQVRDILYVDDLFDVWDRATKEIKLASGQIFNVGGGIENTVSLLESIKILEEVLKVKIKYKFHEWRPGDQKIFVSDITKAKHILNWLPKYSTRSGIARMVEWLKSNQELFL